MGKYLGNTGLGYLWSKYKQRYELKSNELAAGTYTHSVSGNSPIPVTITIITSHVNIGGTTRYTDTLTCTLS